ncbi:AraC family transcriptional regulator [Butyricicoccus pullicaecorum]|nr:AraC family transcriptional regulator [Butyricicoccus pullicaecorum]
MKSAFCPNPISFLRPRRPRACFITRPCAAIFIVPRNTIASSPARAGSSSSFPCWTTRAAPPAEEKRRLDQPGHRLYPHPHRGEDLPVSVAEISAQVGYPNSSNLITLFTQRVGCSPSQFRKENRLSHRSSDRKKEPFQALFLF